MATPEEKDLCRRFCDTRHEDSERLLASEISGICNKIQSMDKWIHAEINVINEKIKASERALSVASIAQEKALNLAENNLKEHLNKLNGSFERQLEERSNFLTIAEYGTRHEVIVDKINGLVLKLTQIETRYDNRLKWSVVISTASALIAIMTVITRYMSGSPWVKG